MQENKVYLGLEAGVNAVMKIVLQYNKPVLILDAGGSCSGKGCFTKMMTKKGRPLKKSVSTVLMDGCFRDIDDPCLPRDGKTPIFDIPGSYHLDEIRSHAATLIKGMGIEYPQYDVASNKRIAGLTKPISSADIIIVDGLFAISELSNLCRGRTIKVFIDAGESVRLKRRIERDRKYGISEEVITRVFTNRIAPLHWKYVEPQKAMADIVIMNNLEEAEQ